MKLKTFYIAGSMALALLAGACQKSAKLSIEMPDLPDGTEVSVITYADSATVIKGMTGGGKLSMEIPAEEGTLTELKVDGKTVAFYVVEGGEAIIKGDAESASGTPLNDRFTAMMHRLDSIDNLDDLRLYADAARQTFRDNRDNALGLYAYSTWLRFADLADIQKELPDVPDNIKNAKRQKKLMDAANLRAATAPGKKYADFSAPQPDGTTRSLSSYMQPGKYTLVDFWASWCPYCIKELPELRDLYNKYKDSNLILVGVAVRDEEADTKTAVEKHGISWPVMYNTRRIPYDKYGIGGIPHHILISPDGTIISRGESVKQLDTRLQSLLKQK